MGLHGSAQQNHVLCWDMSCENSFLERKGIPTPARRDATATPLPSTVLCDRVCNVVDNLRLKTRPRGPHIRSCRKVSSTQRIANWHLNDEETGTKSLPSSDMFVCFIPPLWRCERHMCRERQCSAGLLEHIGACGKRDAVHGRSWSVLVDWCTALNQANVTCAPDS